MAKFASPPRDRTATAHIGVVDQIIYASPARDFVILSTTEGHVVKGPGDSEQFPRGTMWKWLGVWDDSPRGPQFRFETFVPHLGHGKTGVVSYLTKTCEGIGERLAVRLWDKYGGEVVSLLREKPEQVAAECGIPAVTCHEAGRSLGVAKRFEATRIALFSLLNRRGFQGKLIDEALTKWGDRAPAVIKRNPFALLGLTSAGYKRCDKLWCDLGLPKNRLKRAGIVAWNLIERDTNGNTWVAAESLASQLRDTVGGCDPVRAIKFALRVRKLAKKRDADNKLWLASAERARDEERIAAAVPVLAQGASLWPVDRLPVSTVEGDKLPSRHQIDQLRRATSSPFGILLGGPGSGKTFLAGHLIREVVDEYGSDSVRCVCPTGKAAKRLTDMLAEAGVSVRARTIHSTLEIGRNGHDGSGWGFRRNRKNPLDCKFLLIDEPSMVDANLLANLLDACVPPSHVPALPEIPEQTFDAGDEIPPRCLRCYRPLIRPESLLIGYGPECARKVSPSNYRPVSATRATRRITLPYVAAEPEQWVSGTQILMTGDPYQLPPVGHGAPLRDLIAAGVSHGELTEIRRNAGLIVEACADIKAGKRFAVAEKIDLEAKPPQNVRLIETRDEQHAADQLVTVLGAMTRFDPVWETQVIVARNKGGAVARKTLNERLQGALNPDGHAVKENPFRVNDKIICLKNCRMTEVVLDYATEAGGAYGLDATHYVEVKDEDHQAVEVDLANGEIGRVVAISPSVCVARFSLGDTLVKIPMGKRKGDADEEGEGGGEEGGKGCNFDLGYAVTCHKAQGSQWPCVIVVGDENGGSVTGREWAYTAISRAEKMCLLIGKRATFDKMCGRVGLTRRKTFLAPMVREAMREVAAAGAAVVPGLKLHGDGAVEVEVETVAERVTVRCGACGTESDAGEVRCFVCMTEFVAGGGGETGQRQAA